MTGIQSEEYEESYIYFTHMASVFNTIEKAQNIVQYIDDTITMAYTNIKGDDYMIVTNFSNVRNNFKEVCDHVVQDSDVAIITRKNDENVVLMSQVQYDNMMENLYIRGSKANYDRIRKSIKQAEAGRLVQFEVEE